MVKDEGRCVCIEPYRGEGHKAGAGYIIEYKSTARPQYINIHGKGKVNETGEERRES